MSKEINLNHCESHIHTWLDDILEQWKTPGISISFTSREGEGKTWETKNISRGVKDAEGSPYDAESVFLIASCSKVFVAYAMGLLIADKTILQNGKGLSWETKLKDIFPDFALQDEHATQQADIIDLLSMRIGLPGHDGILGSQTSAELVHQLRHLPLSAGFRQIRQYSNIAFDVGAHIVAELSKMPYTKFVRERIFGPLGMKNSTFDPRDANAAGKRVQCFVQSTMDEREAAAAWHSRKDDDTRVPEACASKAVCYEWAGSQPYELNAGCGGLWTTGPDMMQWMKELSASTLIPKDVHDQIFTPYSIPFANSPYPESGHLTYGLGTYVHTYRGHKAFSHGGGCPGQYSYQLVLPELGKGVFVHANDDTHSWWISKAAVNTMMDKLLGEPWMATDWMKIMLKTRWSPPFEDCETPDSYSPPSASEPDITGDYSHAAYPTLSITPLANDDKRRAYLPTIQARLEKDLHLDGSRPLFVSEVHTLYVETVIFVPKSDSIFTWVATKLYKTAGSKNPDERVVAFVDGVGTCKFSREGLGMSGDWWISGGKRRREISISSNDVEVWYDKTT